MHFAKFYGFNNIAELIKKQHCLRVVFRVCFGNFISKKPPNRPVPFNLKPEDVTLRVDGNMSHSLSLTPGIEMCSVCLIDCLVERS